MVNCLHIVKAAFSTIVEILGTMFPFFSKLLKVRFARDCGVRRRPATCTPIQSIPYNEILVFENNDD